MKNRKTTSDAVEILHRRYDEAQSVFQAPWERHNGTSPQVIQIGGEAGICRPVRGLADFIG